uniref:Rab-GAP TBC domain-containing protein n=1 Tax=Macrostomum lignano TaxID=282301 RepID=A0A1I8H374_9PLAT
QQQQQQQPQQQRQQPNRAKPKLPAPGLGVRQSGYSTAQIHSIYCAHRRLSEDAGGGGSNASGGKSADTVEKESKFASLIGAAATNMDELRRLAWSGVTHTVRPIVWKLLIKYAPVNSSRRAAVLQEKRRMYAGMVDEYYGKRTQPANDGMYKQILKDLVRMTVLAEHTQFHQVFARILFIWSMRRPASTYVQGMNDLVTPYFIVYLSEYCTVDVDSSDRLRLRGEPPNDSELASIEADCYWSLSALLDTIQENFVFPQPGIQQNVLALRKIIQRVDGDLDSHLERHDVEYLQFAFRWMNNLLMREIPLRCIIRLWDTYHSEVDGFSHFHLYVCAAFLLRFSRDLKRESDFQGLMLMLQDLPTHQWGDEEVTLLLAEAFKLKSWFADAPNHLDKAIHS